jgi:hypothetical protein
LNTATGTAYFAKNNKASPPNLNCSLLSLNLANKDGCSNSYIFHKSIHNLSYESAVLVHTKGSDRLSHGARWHMTQQGHF